jgi:sterol desaturase/sphingolipid hydroxylase (fatty acid hydroxylase superfamily)
VVSFPPELRRYRLLVITSSVLLAGAAGVALFVAFSPRPVTQSPLPFVLFAIVAVPVALFGVFFVPRWYHRAGYIVASERVNESETDSFRI